MANSVHTRMQGLIDLISRPSRPPNAPAQQGDAFRKSMMDPEGQAPEAATSAPAPARDEANAGKPAPSDLNWIDSDGAAQAQAQRDGDVDASPGTAHAAAVPEKNEKPEAGEPAAIAAAAAPEDTTSEAGDGDEAGAPDEAAVAAVAAPVDAEPANTNPEETGSRDTSADPAVRPQEMKADQTIPHDARMVKSDETADPAREPRPADETATAQTAQKAERPTPSAKAATDATPAPSAPQMAETGTPESDAAAPSKADQAAAPARDTPSDRPTSIRPDDRSASDMAADETVAVAAGSAAVAAATRKDASVPAPPQAGVQAATVQRAAPKAVRAHEQGSEKRAEPASGKQPAETPAGMAAPAAMTPPEETSGSHSLSDMTGKPESLFSIAQPVAGAPGPAINVANGIVLQGMQPNAAMIATPPEVVDIVRAKLAGPDGSDRITVQLDPPELGRVSIDFKFDAQQGLQHITVTGDTPEAMRQLRQLHFQLTQALEQHGLSSQDMSFRQNTSQQGQQPSGRFSGGPLSFAEDELATHTLTAASLPSRSRTIAAGLDIKL